MTTTWQRLTAGACAFSCVLLAAAAFGCKGSSGASSAASEAPFMAKATAQTPGAPGAAGAIDAPPADQTGGFDGKRAYEHVAKQVGFGPRPTGSPAIEQLQEYLQSELKSYGCTVETDSFSADTPAGRLPMKNILVKIPGEKPGIILLGTHYDTKRLENFVGADDGGSSTGVMLELARNLCKQKGRYAVWIAFFDAEEAVNREWQDPDNTYGSRQMAARFAASGDLPKIKAFILADLVGTHTPHFKREGTEWLSGLVWGVGKRLGYGNIFLDVQDQVSDDHDSFLKRKVPATDVIDLDLNDVPYWHKPQDTLDKIDAKTLAIVGHVFLESVKELQTK